MTNDTINFNNPEFSQFLKDNYAINIEGLHKKFIDSKGELCSICMANVSTFKCPEGGHFICCNDCLRPLYNNNINDCPICRRPDVIPYMPDINTGVTTYPLFKSYDSLSFLSKRLIEFLSGNYNFKSGEIYSLFNFLLTQPFQLLKELLIKHLCFYIFIENDSENDENPTLWFGVLVSDKRLLIMKDLNEFNKHHSDRNDAFYKRLSIINNKYYNQLTNEGVKGYFTATKTRKVRLIAMSRSDTSRRNTYGMFTFRT